MLDRFVLRHTKVQRAALVPEIELYLAADPQAIFVAAAASSPGREDMTPMWAFAWPGGQALARHVLDRPDVVRGKRVLDLGAGSGLAAIAAARAGAAVVVAADVDPLAAAAVRINAAHNGVAIETTTEDVIGSPPECDIILMADVVYDPELATRIAGLLEHVSRQGVDVLMADRTSARRPPGEFELVGTYDAPLTPPLPELDFRAARLWRLTRSRQRKGP